MEKYGKIQYPPFINECAIYIGKLRDLYNYDLYQSHEKYRRGTKNELVHILGLKGELIFSYYLQHIGVKHQTNTLLSNKPVIDYDIKIGNIRIDVKALNYDAPALLVNYDSHNKNKGITNYVFVRILDEFNADYWVFKHEEISNWEVKTLKFTNAYSLDIDKI